MAVNNPLDPLSPLRSATASRRHPEKRVRAAGALGTTARETHFFPSPRPPRIGHCYRVSPGDVSRCAWRPLRYRASESSNRSHQQRVNPGSDCDVSRVVDWDQAVDRDQAERLSREARRRSSIENLDARPVGVNTPARARQYPVAVQDFVLAACAAAMEISCTLTTLEAA